MEPGRMQVILPAPRFQHCSVVGMMHWRRNRSLIRNWHNHKARHLKTVVLRYENRSEEALQLIAESLKLDRFNFGCLYERFLLTQSESDLSAWKELMREEANNYHELALDYAAAGCWKEAVDVLNQAVSGGFATPMTHYYIGWCSVQGGLHLEEEAFKNLASCLSGLLFPESSGRYSCTGMCNTI